MDDSTTHTRIVMSCECGLHYTLVQFRTLELSYVQRYRDGKQPDGIEARHCVCGSTRGIDVDRKGNWAPGADDD